MKRILISTLILLGFLQNLKSQNEDLQTDRFEFSIMPYSLFDYNPRLRFGLEYYSSKKVGYSIDFGFGNDFFNQIEFPFRNCWGENYALFELRAELKYFFILREHIAFYNGLELFSIHTEDVLKDGWFRNSPYQPEDEKNMVTQYDRADFYRLKYGAQLKAGLKLIAFKRVDFDFYIGIGLAYRTVDYSNVINPRYIEYYILRDLWAERHGIAGESILLHFSLGSKIGIIIWGDR